MTEQPRERLVRLASEALRERLQDPKNVAKGDGWREMCVGGLFGRVYIEMKELGHEIYGNENEGTPARMRHEIGDCIAYLAMMLDKIETKE